MLSTATLTSKQKINNPPTSSIYLNTEKPHKISTVRYCIPSIYLTTTSASRTWYSLATTMLRIRLNPPSDFGEDSAAISTQTRASRCERDAGRSDRAGVYGVTPRSGYDHDACVSNGRIPDADPCTRLRWPAWRKKREERRPATGEKGRSSVSHHCHRWIYVPGISFYVWYVSWLFGFCAEACLHAVKWLTEHAIPKWPHSLKATCNIPQRWRHRLNPKILQHFYCLNSSVLWLNGFTLMTGISLNDLSYQ